MCLPQTTLSILIVLLITETCRSINVKKNEALCQKQAETPNFDKNTVIGKPWRIYYTWNLDFKTKCIDYIVKNASEAITKRISDDMAPYLEEEPDWDMASLYTMIGPSKRGVLLIEKGRAGNFVGVPNLARDDVQYLDMDKPSVSLYKFFLKLIQPENFLLVMDCNLGVAVLLSRDRPPKREDIIKVAGSLAHGKGAEACV